MPKEKNFSQQTRSLSQALADKDIRVNGVAPGPIWTPLIPSTFPAKEVETFGSDVPLGRPGQPEEVAPSYVFLASDFIVHDRPDLASKRWHCGKRLAVVAVTR
jgi:NAD(P)-dependent dehydrogenase (short-subunit alcohol dehydrogenase family)